jgi:anti-sigma B factor antagonist
MEWNVVDLENGMTKIAVSGRMDVQGALAIDPVFSQLSAEKPNLIVDMSNVSFLASLGIRTLVMSAKTLAAKGGHFVLFGLQPGVEKVLTTSGLNAMIPSVSDQRAAEALASR